MMIRTVYKSILTNMVMASLFHHREALILRRVAQKTNFKAWGGQMPALVNYHRDRRDSWMNSARALKQAFEEGSK